MSDTIEVKKSEVTESQYWLTPPDLYKQLDEEFHFDFDPCPYPWDGVDGTEIEWGKSTYLNPPFCKKDGHIKGVESE